jgi:hypothetical protein
MLTNLTPTASARGLVSTQAIRQPPTAPPQEINSLLERGA